MAYTDSATDSTPNSSSGSPDEAAQKELMAASSVSGRAATGTSDRSRTEAAAHASHLSSAVLAAMPVTLHVGIPIDRFRLETLAALRPGSIVKTLWPGSEDMPVSSGSIRIAWAEFATTDDKRSVRVTRVA